MTRSELRMLCLRAAARELVAAGDAERERITKDDYRDYVVAGGKMYYWADQEETGQ